MGSSPGSAREEAERLVAAVLAAASLAAKGASGRGGLGLGPLGDAILSAAGHAGAGALRGGTQTGSMATGSAECCVCPVCRAIAAVRDPSPEFTERLATGAGDVAAGVTSLLRSLSPPADAWAAATAAEPSKPAAGRPEGSGQR